MEEVIDTFFYLFQNIKKDRKTIISDEEMEIRMRRDETTFDPFQIFRENIRREILIDSINLMEIPSSSKGRELRRDFRRPSFAFRLMSKNMVTKAEPDSDIFYLTEKNKLRLQGRTYKPIEGTQ